MKLQICILAGGKSSRMGEDKGLLLYQGRPLVQHVIEAARPLGYPIKLIGSTPAYDCFGLDRIHDRIPGQGPAGGILAALQDAASGKVLVLPCDMPGVRTSWLRLLIGKSEGWEVLISESPGGPEPLCGVYSCLIETGWEQSMHSGVLKLTDLIGKFKNSTLKLVDFPDENQDMFANINTPDDLEKINRPSVLRVLAFGRLSELLGSRSMEIPHVETVGDLKMQLERNYPGIRSAVYTVAVDQVIASDEQHIQPGSEVALLPPFSGG